MGSDHSPILLHTDPSTPPLRRSFRCYEFWFKYPQCQDIIASSWKTNIIGSLAYQFVTQLKATKIALKQWKNATFSDISASTAQVQAHLQAL